MVRGKFLFTDRSEFIHFIISLEILKKWNNELIKIVTPRSVANWNFDPNQAGPLLNEPQTARPDSPHQESSSGFSAPQGPPKKKKKKQLGHEEVLREYDGPARSAECIKKSIEFFSSCENLVWKNLDSQFF